MRLTSQGGGLHTVELNPAPEPGEWLKVTFHVTGQDSGQTADLTVWVAHHPGDINQDGVVNIRDATAFGEEFGGQASLLLVDLNGDGVADVRDASTFGEIWRGAGDATKVWEGHELPPKPE